ncbi:hypothetical protein BC939DRAFT_522758 [Gamsiella multidivaricata]|uniref:uncharacterized protein n=1 Tax=Gamsiella multidivaricata TaxID=101098 RepID=UPI00221F0AAC|nr:uncharacterized protein BC939DRAFT_522758 [Gamsiella multidivaricata]KAI7818075.1 hypothetical protein BC939DRAFT_522758 [Gamsiella multidivaricata]
MSVLAIESAPHLQQKTEQQPLQGKIQEHDQDSSSTQADGSLLRRTHRHIYIAVPSPTTPTLIDVYDIVKPERTFASIGGNSNTSSSVSGETVKKWGSVMAIQLFQTRYAVSCGSDNVLAKYDLDGSLQGVPEVTQVALKANGIADIKIRSDNKIIGLAGWDGRIRVYSAKTLKPLAVLKHHRESLYCLAFAAVNSVESAAAGTDADVSSGEYDGKQPLETRDGGHAEKKEDGSDAWSDSGSDSESEEEDNSDLEDALEERRRWSRRHWIAVGGKENRVSLWELY